MNENIFKLKNDTLTLIDWANVYGWSGSLNWEIDPVKLYKFLKNNSYIYDIRFYNGTDAKNRKSIEFMRNVAEIGYTVISKEVKWIPIYLEKQNHLKKIIAELFKILEHIKSKNMEISVKSQNFKEEFSKGRYFFKAKVELLAEEEKHYYLVQFTEGLRSELEKLNQDVIEFSKIFKKPILRRKCDFDVEISRDIYNNLNKFKTLILFSGDGDYAALVEDIIRKGRNAIVVFGKGHKGREYDKIKKGLYLCSVEKLRGFIEK